MSSGTDGKLGNMGSLETENREAEKLKQRNQREKTR
jgi:hypothetical protein